MLWSSLELRAPALHSARREHFSPYFCTAGNRRDNLSFMFRVNLNWTMLLTTLDEECPSHRYLRSEVSVEEACLRHMFPGLSRQSSVFTRSPRSSCSSHLLFPRCSRGTLGTGGAPATNAVLSGTAGPTFPEYDYQSSFIFGVR